MQVQNSFNELDDPTEPLAHGAMILFSGALLLTPGFFTDAVGFSAADAEGAGTGCSAGFAPGSSSRARRRDRLQRAHLSEPGRERPGGRCDRRRLHRGSSRSRAVTKGPFRLDSGLSQAETRHEGLIRPLQARSKSFLGDRSCPINPPTTGNGPDRRRPAAPARRRCRFSDSSSGICPSKTSWPRKGVQGEVQPDVQVQVNLDAKKRSVGQPVRGDHQVQGRVPQQGPRILRRSSCMELEYGGIFLIENVPEEQLHPFLLIECPRMLFPFVRRIVSATSPATVASRR